MGVFYTLRLAERKCAINSPGRGRAAGVYTVLVPITVFIALPMNQKTILIALGALVALGAAVAAYLAWAEQAPATTPEVQSYGTDNPLEKKPDLNPAEKTNPFADVKTNPFQ